MKMVKIICICITLLIIGSGVNTAIALQAYQNTSIDPWGRVIDVTFDQNTVLTAPLERFRFKIDIVQPLSADSGAFLGDLNGDGILDLVLTGFGGEAVFYPGIAGNP